MFSKKKETKAPPAKARGKGGMNQLGLLDMGGMMDFDPSSLDDIYDDDDDEGLEAELLALTSGKAPTKAKRKPRVNAGDLDAMIAASLKDTPSDEDDGSDLEDDPALLAELMELTPDGEEEVDEVEPEINEEPVKTASPRRSAPPPPSADDVEVPMKKHLTSGSGNGSSSLASLIVERVEMYKAAISNAKTANDSSKVRRYERGLKTLETQLKSVQAGRSVNEDDIPPPVATGKAPPPTTTIPPSPPSVSPPLPPPPQIEPDDSKPPPLPPRMKPPLVPQRIHPEITGGESAFAPSAPPKSPSPPSRSPEKAPSEPQDDVTEPMEEVAFQADKPITDQSVLLLLTTRRDQYKQAALKAKTENDKATAIGHVKTVKKFEAVIQAMEQGQPIDLSQMPPPPPGYANDSDLPASALAPPPPVPTPRTATSQAQGSSPPSSSRAEGDVDMATATEPDPSLFNAPAAPSSTLEALEQRRDKYLSTQQQAKEEENSSKARRMGRIVKQYEDAIKLYKAGKPVPFDELPDPPGFAPIPRATSSTIAAVAPKPQPRLAAPEGPPPPAPGAAPSPAPSPVTPRAAPTVPAVPQQAEASPKAPTLAPGVAPAKKSSPQSRLDKQMNGVLQRQRLFREAALDAKKRNDIPAAKEYLRQSKGFDPMIEALKCGIPVNLDSSPLPPQMAKGATSPPGDSFEVIDHEDCLPPGDRDEIYERLETDLRTQVAMCLRNGEHFQRLGDVSNMQKFRLLAEHSKKDMDSVKYASKRGDKIPKFHYETRVFSIVQCNTDLNDNELKLEIVRGINYHCSNPKEVDTYVKFEFPFPTESPQHDKTHTTKDTNNPDYNQSFTLQINRKVRTLQRVFKRGTIKLDIMSKGGFLRSDTPLGKVEVKLAPLETKCTIHDSFDVMDGRRATGGKLEVRVTIRDPLLTKQVDEIKEKWLVIDKL